MVQGRPDTSPAPPADRALDHPAEAPDRLPDPRRGCPRWPAGLLLRWQRGDVVGYAAGRCKGTNVCDYCSIQAAHENARMLAIDALDGPAPEVVGILGTRTPTADPKPFYLGRQLVVRALRREFGRGVEYACQSEFTTGNGPRAGGQRRPHWNLLVKGVAGGQAADVEAIAVAVWCQHVDAEPQAQYVQELQSTAAFMRYVAMHFQKQSQAPPPGWAGQRFNCSRGYFEGRTRREMRHLARAELQRERTIFKVRRDAPELDPDDVLEVAEQLLWQHYERSWSIVSVGPRRAEQLLAGSSRPPGHPPVSEGTCRAL